MHEYDTAHHDGTTARLALGRALREMHKRSNRTLRAVERDISISDSTLSRYFRGKAVPSWPTVEKICASFGEDPEPVRHLWTVAIAERSNADFPVGDANAAPAGSGTATDETAVCTDSSTSTSTAAQELASDGGDQDDGRAESDGGDGDRVARLRRRIVHASRGRAVWLGTGLVLGFALGAAATALDLRGGAAAPTPAGRAAGTGAVSVQSQGHGAPVPAATGTYCPWKYVVTDGNTDNIRVYDDPQHDSIIARYAPNEVFYASDPPQIINSMMKTEDGWIGMGNWVQRYTHGTCRVGGY